MNPLDTVRLIVGTILTAALIASGAVVWGWHKDSLALDDAQADLKEIAEQSAYAINTLAAQQRASYAASEGYQRELEDLRNRPVPVRVVRVLVPARAPLPAAGSSPGRPDGPGQGAGLVHSGTRETPSRDIFGDLAALTLEADRCSAQLRGLQAWVTLSTPRPAK